jgi:(1->4)-alpha-D-glucan 1-alpha-D-glucosylmutase
VSARIPSATYRLQLNSDFTLADACQILEYLSKLGITDCYLSPIAQARAGSRHGYDVIDHTRVSSDLGGESAFRAFALRARQLGMGIIVDNVPNHMCIADPGNEWWWDVLENGPSSPYASFFDIDWHPPKDDLTNKVLLPVLGDQYGRILESKELTVVYSKGAFKVTYYEMVFPLAPRSWTHILEPVYSSVQGQLGESDRQTLELASIITALDHLPLRTETDTTKVRERQREKEVIKSRLSTLVETSSVIRSALDQTLSDLNGTKNVSSSFDNLERLLADQAYRLSFWRVAADEINYRRFSDVNDLAAIRVESPDVFSATHALILKLIGEGLVTGLRIDHVDGLRDPAGYLRLLQAETARARGLAGVVPIDSHEIAQVTSRSESPLYIVVEKILGPTERLRSDWPVNGTTGYEFLNDLTRLFVTPQSREKFRGLYLRFAARGVSFDNEVYDAKKLILRASMSGEQAVLARKLDSISEQHRWSRDFTLNSLGRALAEMIASFPVYRSYVTSAGVVNSEDRRYVTAAADEAKRRNPALSESTFDFIASVLLLEHPAGLSEDGCAQRLDFTLLFQQTTAPVMAKGFEDTALYRFYPLASLNEVGGNPAEFGISAKEFHTRNLRRLHEWPHAMLSTATHDTKRGEDVRARIDVLSEIPEEWRAAIRRWHKLNAHARTKLAGSFAPDKNEEYLFYQSLVGIWTEGATTLEEQRRLLGRVESYMHKAIKEAKLHTSWLRSNREYEEAVISFVRKVLEPSACNRFPGDFARFHRQIAVAGMLNSLSQTLLKICSPGVPDFYQGTELWDDNLVDPDNRRPVDFAPRRATLEQISRWPAAERRTLVDHMLSDSKTGKIKLYLIWCALNFRREHAKLFACGDYMPMNALGQYANNVIAFTRNLEGQHSIIIVGRFFTQLAGSSSTIPTGETWADTAVALPEFLGSDRHTERYFDVLTGAPVENVVVGSARLVRLKDVFARLPLALLTPLVE